MTAPLLTLVPRGGAAPGKSLPAPLLSSRCRQTKPWWPGGGRHPGSRHGNRARISRRRRHSHRPGRWWGRGMEATSNPRRPFINSGRRRWSRPDLGHDGLGRAAAMASFWCIASSLTMTSWRIMGNFRIRTPRAAALGMVVVTSTSAGGGRAVHLEASWGSGMPVKTEPLNPITASDGR
jgi:hypothetical protein